MGPRRIRKNSYFLGVLSDAAGVASIMNQKKYIVSVTSRITRDYVVSAKSGMAALAALAAALENESIEPEYAIAESESVPTRIKAQLSSDVEHIEACLRA